jgi:predicted Zn-ribbon and HTH transcriptional regulator
VYVPKTPGTQKKNKGRWSVAVPAEDVEYVSSFEDYKEFMKYPHTCKKCGGRMQILSSKEVDEGLICPVCKRKMDIDDIIMWD